MYDLEDAADRRTDRHSPGYEDHTWHWFTTLDAVPCEANQRPFIVCEHNPPLSSCPFQDQAIVRRAKPNLFCPHQIEAWDSQLDSASHCRPEVLIGDKLHLAENHRPVSLLSLDVPLDDVLVLGEYPQVFVHLGAIRLHERGDGFHLGAF